MVRVACSSAWPVRRRDSERKDIRDLQSSHGESPQHRVLVESRVIGADAEGVGGAASLNPLALLLPLLPPSHTLFPRFQPCIVYPFTEMALT